MSNESDEIEVNIEDYPPAIYFQISDGYDAVLKVDDLEIARERYHKADVAYYRAGIVPNGDTIDKNEALAALENEGRECPVCGKPLLKVARSKSGEMDKYWHLAWECPDVLCPQPNAVITWPIDDGFPVRSSDLHQAGFDVVYWRG